MVRDEFLPYTTVSFKNLAQHDHKRVLEGDEEKILVVWAYSPSRLINKELEEKIISKIIEPTLKVIRDRTTYKVFVY